MLLLPIRGDTFINANIKCGCPICFCVKELHGGSRFRPEVLLPNQSLCVPAQPWLRTMVLSIKPKRFALVRAWLSEVSLVPSVFIGINKEKYPKFKKFFGDSKYVLMTLSGMRLLQHIVDDTSLREDEWTLVLEDDAFLNPEVPAQHFPLLVQKALRESADVGWVYLCSFDFWAVNEQPNYTMPFPSENRSYPVYSSRHQTRNGVAYILTKWRARRLLASMFQCQERIIDRCYLRHMKENNTFPTVVFLDRTSKWPGLIGQARNLDDEMRSSKFASEEDMTPITRLPRWPHLCNSFEQLHHNRYFGDRVHSAEKNLNFTEFLSKLTTGALQRLSDDPDFPPKT